MSNQRSYYQPKFLREIQLGLVVFGGVSLAIYTHGVCQEFYHAVRGRGIYKLVKAITDADLVVDAISGSSAGGINGVLLSYALANSNERELVDFSAFASIWRNSGDLLKLIRKPNLFKSSSAESSLDSHSFYQRGLIAALTRGVEYKMPRSPQEWFSPSQELDLAIAGTNYLGKVDRTIDESGVHLGVKNHRTLFYLKHRQGRKEPFNPNYQEPNLPKSPEDTYQALAKLCQITAGTPIIFPLVEVDLQDRSNLVDRQLAIWGKLEQSYAPDLAGDLSGHKLYFLDGGLLDTSPFTCLMKETYYRLPSRAGRRKLFYVDPNPENLNDRVNLKGDKKSRMGQMWQATVLSIPIHQSVNNDLRKIEEHNHKVRRYQMLIDRAEAAVNSQQILESSDRTQVQIYLRGRLFDFRDRNLPWLLHSDLGAQNAHYSAIIERIDMALTDKYDRHKDRDFYHKLLTRFEPQTIDLDIEYSMRKHFYVVDRIADLLNTNIDNETNRRLQNLSKQLGCNIKLLEVVRSGIELLLKDRSVTNSFYYLINDERRDRRLPALVYEVIFRLHRFLLDETKFQTFIPDELSGSNLETVPGCFWLDLPELAAENNGDRWLSQNRISSVFAQIKQRINSLHQSSDLRRLILTDPQLEYDENSNCTFPSILKRIELAAEVSIERSRNRYTDELRKYWNTFEAIDRELYPFEYLSNLTEKQVIKPISISPDRAQLGMSQGKITQEKLGGSKLYNIGGFFKKSWRSNDLLWGRLDGLNRILEGIITPQSIVAFPNFVYRESTRTNKTPTQYLDWLLTESLPHISGAERQKIYQHLERLAQPQSRIERAELREILADLVLAGHQEILTSDVHSIVEGLDEQPGWWKLPNNVQSLTDRLHSNQNIGNNPSIPASNPTTIVRIVHQSLTNLAIQQQNFFRHQYRIGVEKLWTNMPLVTLISLSTKIVLFLRNFLIEIFKLSSPSQTTRHPLYHWLDGLLQSIYWWLQGGTIEIGSVHRRSRIIFLQFLGAITAICSVILAFLLSPFWFLFALPGVASYWFLKNMRLKRLTGGKNSS